MPVRSRQKDEWDALHETVTSVGYISPVLAGKNKATMLGAGYQVSGIVGRLMPESTSQDSSMAF
jgi:hypothetical protein